MSADANPPIAPSQRASCERLEYGKFTNALGMVDGTEHRRLASTSAFPQEVARFCGPRLVGPSLQDNDALPPWAAHGTVLQPVSAAGHVVPVFARVRELPEVRTSRRYQRGTYAVVPADLSPMSLLRAFDGLPVEQFARQDVPVVLPQLLVAQEPGPVGVVSSGFVNMALECVLAGIPVVIRGEIDEARFFELVDSVWWRLPTPTRKWLSAGWGVGRSLDARLAISAGLTGGAVSAVYDVVTGAWQIPESPDALERKFSRGYVRIVYEGDAGTSERHLDRMQWMEEVLTLSAPDEQVLGWDQPAVREAFNTIGRAAWDAWRLDGVRRALAQHEWRAADPESVFKDFWCEGTRRLCVDVMLSALTTSQSRRTAARVLARAWRINPELVEEETGRMPADVRAMSLEVIQRTLAQSHTSALRHLDTSLAGTEADPFEDAGVFTALASGIQQLDLPAVDLHERVLQRAVLPLVYGEFIADFAWPLALAIDAQAPARTCAIVDRLLVHAPEDVRRSLRRLRCLALYELPNPEDRTVSSADVKELGPRVAARWRARSITGAQRDVLLEWALLFPEPLLPVVESVRASRAGVDPPSPTPADVAILAREVAGGRIPPAAERVVATVVANHLERFLDAILEIPSAWACIARHWPAAYRHILGFAPTPTHDAAWTLPPPVRGFREQQVEQLLRFWCEDRHAYLGLPGVVQNLVALINEGRFNKPMAPTAWTCARLLENELTFFINHPDEIDFDAAERAARLLRVFPATEREKCLRPHTLWQLWSRCDVSGSVLLTLLMLFHDIEFEFSALQQIRLGRHREPLRRHLADPVVNPKRKQQLECAAAPFHAFDYAVNPSACPTTVLWGAFRGVPLEHQRAPLRDVLDHYASSPRARLELCERYLEGMSHCPAGWRVAEQLIEAFVEPLIGDAGHSRLRNLLHAVRRAASSGDGLRGINVRDAGPGLIAVDWPRMGDPLVIADRGLVEFLHRLVQLERARPSRWSRR